MKKTNIITSCWLVWPLSLMSLGLLEMFSLLSGTQTLRKKPHESQHWVLLPSLKTPRSSSTLKLSLFTPHVEFSALIETGNEKKEQNFRRRNSNNPRRKTEKRRALKTVRKQSSFLSCAHIWEAAPQVTCILSATWSHWRFFKEGRSSMSYKSFSRADTSTLMTGGGALLSCRNRRWNPKFRSLLGPAPEWLAAITPSADIQPSI